MRRNGKWLCALHTESVAGDPFGRDRMAAALAGAQEDGRVGRSHRDRSTPWGAGLGHRSVRPSLLSKPENYYTELRAKGPFAYIPKYAGLACGRYDVTKEVFSDWHRFVSSRGVGLQDFRLEKPWRPPSIVLEVDPPYHDKTRRVLNRALSPKAVADLKNAFQVAARG